MKNLERLSDTKLLNEFSNYGKSKKAEFVYFKCLRNKKYILADKIKMKYNLNFNDDRVASLEMALIASKKLTNNS